MVEDDDSLMRRVAEDGDADAFGRLVRTHQARLLCFAERMTGGDAETAEDAVQEAFLRLWRGRTRYQPQGALIGFLLRVVRNICLDYERMSRPDAPLEDDLPSAETPEDRLVACSLGEAVREAVARLPEAQRAVFVLSQYQGMSYGEIAEVLACPVGTVASRKHLAVEALRRRLRPWMEEK